MLVSPCFLRMSGAFVILKPMKNQHVPLFFSTVFDQLDVISYEEVVQLPAFNRKTLVLIGKDMETSCTDVLC